MLRIKDQLAPYWNALSKSWRFAIVSFLVVRLFYAVWSWIILSIQPMAVQNIELAGEPVLTIFNLQDSQSYTYRREINGETLTFQAAGAGIVTDMQSGSIWDISAGAATEGPLAGLVLPPAQTPPSEIFPYHQVKPYSGSWLALWQRFDASWYLSIAKDGYSAVRGDIHFPPLFPLLIRGTAAITGDAFLAGLLIAHLAALYALKLLYDTFADWGGIPLAKRSVLFMLLYPASFFLFSVYTESLFLVTVLLSLRKLKERSWAWSGFWAFCAVLIRLQGAALIVPMLYVLWSDRSHWQRPVPWFGLGVFALGGLIYIFLRSTLPSTDLLPIMEADLRTRMASPWEGYWYGLQTLISNRFTFIDLLNFITATLVVVLLIIGWRRIPLEDYSFAVASFLVALSRITLTQPLTGMSRFGLTLFPLFFLLGLAAENPWWRRLIIYSFLSLNLYLSAQFFLWGWVA